MEKLIIEANFHVFVPDVTGRERRVQYTTGMVVEAADLPEGQDPDDWMAKGLATAV